MSDMLERPAFPVEESDGPIDDSANEAAGLNALLASLAEEKLSFDDIPYAQPHSPHEEAITLAAKKVLTNGSDAGTPLSNFRRHLRDTLQIHGHSEDAATDATTIVSELVGNVRLHSAVPDEKYSGECRIRAIKQPVEDELGRRVTQVTTVIEAVNFSSIPVSSQQEQVREEFEGGNGLDLVKRLAEDHGGDIGKYRVLVDGNGHETFIPQTALCGNFVVWATLRTEVLPQPEESSATEA